MRTKERLCTKIVLSIFFLLVLCRTAGAQDARKAILSAADAGTCTANSTACSFLTIPSGAGGVTFTITANASANTIQFEATGDTEPTGSHTWVALNVVPSNGTTAVTSTTSTGTWQANIAGFTQVRLRCSTFVGGTTTTYINLSTASARSNGGGGGGSVTHTAGNLTAFHIMIGNGAADATVDSACITNGTGALSGCTSISAGSGASAAGGTATGGFACAEAASTGWTPTVGQDYQRCDSTLHTFVCSNNGNAEGACGGGTPSFPVTVSGTTTSGGVPYFSSTTVESSSALLAANALIVGGGAGAAPATGNADFTYATHTLTGGAAGLIDLHAMPGNGLELPDAFCTAIGGHTTLASHTSGNGEITFCPTGGGAQHLASLGANSTVTCTNQVFTVFFDVAAPTCTSLTQPFIPAADANHSTNVTIGSGTSIGSTQLCSSANCPAGLYEVSVYLDITTACGTSGTYVVNLIYTDDQGAKTVVVNINGTGATPATGVLLTTSTANFGEDSQVLRLTSGNLNYSTTAVACGTAGPMVGQLYLAAWRKM